MSGGGGGDEYDVNINLTALLDVLTNLLFFLMFGYAAQQYSMEVKGGVQLPDSTAEVAPKKDIELIISKTELRVDDEVVAKMVDGKPADTPLDAHGHYAALTQKLAAIKERRPANLPEGDIVLVLCDRTIPYGILRRVMMSAAEGGFPKYRMGVLMK